MAATDRDTLIHRCKQEVYYRAEHMHLDYDQDDIRHWDLPDGHTVVLLTHIFSPFEEEGESADADSERIKDPTVYITYPPPVMNCFEKPYDWKIEVKTFLPVVHVRFPQLVLIIDPDSKVITSSSVHVLNHIACEDEKTVQQRIFDRWPHECFKRKAEDTIGKLIEREREDDCYR
jgi:hypothetical protein